MSWNEIIFESVFKIPTKNGLTKPSRIRGEGFKFINMGELFAIDRMFDPKMELVPLSETEKVTHKIEKGDLLFARQSLVASGAGKCSIVKEVDDLTVFDSHIIRVRLNQDFCDSNFFYYYFKSSVNNLKSLVQQGVQAGIRASDLSKLKVHYPPLETQKRISSILSTHDDLIENNLKRIKLLEETAQNIYKEWFVNFRFPNYEHTEFDVESGLPLGWELKKVEECIKVMKGKKPKKEYSTIGENRILYLLVDVLERRELRFTENANVQLTSVGETLMLMDGSRSGLVFKSLEGAIGSTLAVFRIKNAVFGINYCFNYFKFREVEIISKNTGSAIPHANKSYIYGMEMPIPTDRISSEFETITSKIYNQIEILSSQNQKLKEARDILLPRLMNRTIEV